MLINSAIFCIHPCYDFTYFFSFILIYVDIISLVLQLLGGGHKVFSIVCSCKIFWFPPLPIGCQAHLCCIVYLVFTYMKEMSLAKKVEQSSMTCSNIYIYKPILEFPSLSHTHTNTCTHSSDQNF